MSGTRDALVAALSGLTDRNERMVAACRVILSRLSELGVDMTVVGGSAVAIWAPSLHVSHDIDLVGVALHSRLDEVMEGDFGLARSGRHWLDAGLGIAIEVPAMALEPDGAEAVDVDGVRVISLEDLLLDRIQQWEAAGSLEPLMQARALLGHPVMDEARLAARAHSTGSTKALLAVRLAAAREVDAPLSHAVQRALSTEGLDGVRRLLDGVPRRR